MQVQQEPQMGWICSPGVLSTYIYIEPDRKNMTYNFIKVVIWVNMLLFPYHFHKGEQLFYWLPPSLVDKNPSKVVSKEECALLIRVGLYWQERQNLKWQSCFP